MLAGEPAGQHGEGAASHAELLPQRQELGAVGGKLAVGGENVEPRGLASLELQPDQLQVSFVVCEYVLRHGDLQLSGGNIERLCDGISGWLRRGERYSAHHWAGTAHPGASWWDGSPIPGASAPGVFVVV